MKKFKNLRKDSKQALLKKLYKNAPSLPTSFGKHSIPVHPEKKINESTESESKVTNPDHIEAIQDYTTASHNINQPLHDGEEVPDFKKRTKRLLDNMFDDKSTHIGKDHVVYTGLNANGHKIFNNLKLDKDGMHRIKQKAYTSTSTDPEIAQNFTTKDDNGQKHILKISVPANHPSVDISHHSAWNAENEKEVLLDRGTLLKIHPATTEKDGFVYHHATVEGHDKDE